MDIDELGKFGMKAIREIELPEHWNSFSINNISNKEILEFFKKQVDLEIELRPLILPEWLYIGLQNKPSINFPGNLLEEIQIFYGRISILKYSIIVK